MDFIESALVFPHSVRNFYFIVFVMFNLKFKRNIDITRNVKINRNIKKKKSPGVIGNPGISDIFQKSSKIAEAFGYKLR